MELDRAITKWIHEQASEDPGHAWFPISDEEAARQLVDQKYVDYGGQSFLVGLNPLDRRIGYVYDHGYKERNKSSTESIQLHDAVSGALQGKEKGGL